MERRYTERGHTEREHMERRQTEKGHTANRYIERRYTEKRHTARGYTERETQKVGIQRGDINGEGIHGRGKYGKRKYKKETYGKERVIQTNTKKRLYREEIPQGGNYSERKHIRRRDTERKRLYMEENI